jgi:EAL domain-containing protein (putative c-di-GMP-specific phosphodiesterase class I)
MVHRVLAPSTAFLNVPRHLPMTCRQARLRDEAVQNVAGTHNDGSLGQGSVPKSPNSTILVIDDDQAFMTACTRMLDLWGYGVVQAPCGEEGLRLLETRSVDLILCDINLPGMSGVEVLRAVRSRDRDVPFILMTGGPEVETARLAVEWGAQSYLIKPLALPQLKDLLERTLQSYHFLRSQRKVLDVSERFLIETKALREQFDRSMAGMWMAFQPIVSWSSKSVVAYEALLRTTDPILHVPTDILRVAETLGEIQSVGHKTRAMIAEVLGHHPELPGVFVNLHVLDLLDEQLYSETSPLRPFASRIHFEITERMALEKVPDTRQRIERLREHGYRIAVDDLGEGYAGLNCFAALEPDAVKLDMSLIRGIDQSPTKRRMVHALASLCKELGTPLVAEGVETPSELAALIELGADWLQGYFFARPDYPLPVPRF